MRAAGVASFFFDVFETAKLRQRATARFGGSHARGDVVGDLLLDVEAQFGVELRFEFRFAK